MAYHDGDIAAVLRGLELELLDPLVRTDEGRLGELLAEEFREFGSSGRVYTRAQIIETLADEMAGEFELSDFVTNRLAEECALVTYRASRHEGGLLMWESLRSSIWIWRAGRWQMLFHQGTRTGRE